MISFYSRVRFRQVSLYCKLFVLIFVYLVMEENSWRYYAATPTVKVMSRQSTSSS